jgi:sulfotransferase family protein
MCGGFDEDANEMNGQKTVRWEGAQVLPLSDPAPTYAGHWGVQLLNAAIRLGGAPKAGLRFEAIVEACEGETGLRDWGGEDYLARLQLSVDCISAGLPLSPLGQLSAAIVLRWYAANRLRIVDWVRQHPEVRSVPITKPIFILGWFRTGTTNLHTVLGLDPNHRVPECWELCCPVSEHGNPHRDHKRRLRKTANKFRLANWLAPEQKYAHELRAENPEECFFLLANSAVSVPQIMGFQGYDYARELFMQDLSVPYQELRLQYQILASQRTARQWVMKCPFHLWNLDALLAAFPDARIIQMHRTAAKAIPSVCSLSAIMSRPFAERFMPARHGAFFREFCRAGIDRAMKIRKTLSASQIVDVRLDDLKRDPVGTARSIYRHFDLDWDEAQMSARIGQHLRAQRRRAAGQEGKHSYTPEQFGLTAAGLREEFQEYESTFLHEPL